MTLPRSYAEMYRPFNMIIIILIIPW